MENSTDTANESGGASGGADGGVNLTSDQSSIGGDVVGRDKVLQVQGDQINTYIQLDLQKLMETLKQALPENDPLPDRLVTALKDFKHYHARLWEWKELHNALNDVIFVFDQFSREVERRDGAGSLGDVRALRRLWRPVDQKVGLLLDFACQIQHVGTPLVTQPDGSRQGPPWAIELAVTADQLKNLFEDSALTLATLYEATCAFSDAAEKHMYLADKQLRDTASELFNLSNALLGSVDDD
jgi:hypothetical protein